MRLTNSFDKRYWVFFIPASLTIQTITTLYTFFRYGGLATRRTFLDATGSTFSERLIGSLPIVLINIVVWFVAFKVFHWMDETYAVEDRFAMTPDQRTEHHQNRLWEALNKHNLKPLVLNASLNLEEMGKVVDQISLSFIFEHEPTRPELNRFETALLEYQTTAPHPEFLSVAAVGPSKQVITFNHLVRKVPVEAMSSGKTFIDVWVKKKKLH